MNNLTPSSAVILVVQDNEDDWEFIQLFFNNAGVHDGLFVVEDGIEALDFLRRRGRFGGAPRPDLILLDINIPQKNGMEVLDEIKNDTSLKRIPVIMMTSSLSESDVLDAYNLHTNAYIIIPVDLDEYARIIRLIKEFWLTAVTLPR